MKIHQLPLGARFEYAGEEYTKTGPLLGTCKDKQRLIPKYAVLRVLGDSGPVLDDKTKTLSRPAVLAAFEGFYAQCAALVPEENQAELRTARTDFLRTLG